MDQKSWLWRKKSTEKTAGATEQSNVDSKGNEEVETCLVEKEELAKDVKRLNEKLSSATSECNAKDELVKKHIKMAQEALAGWQKTEAEVLSLKKELDDALHQRENYEERVAHLDGALRECMQQLRFVQDEKERSMHDVVVKTSKEFEKSKMVLEEQLTQINRRLAKAEVENTHLTKTVLVKENLINELKRQLNQLEADYNAVMIRLESTERDNSSYKYEIRLLEKELEIRNEEREFNRRTADASHKQNLESAKKIAKLESECQRLRLLVRKRLPGPAAMAKMRNEVEMLGRESMEMKRKKSSSSGLVVDSAVDNFPETLTKQMRVLTEQLYAVEEENKTLKEALKKKSNELQFSRVMFARTASRLSQAESQIEDSFKSQLNAEQRRSSLTSHDFSLTTMSDVGSDDKASCADSWASALLSELDQFKTGRQKESPSCRSAGASEINLFDDFAEMEKLAIVSSERSFEGALKEAHATSSPLGNGSNEILRSGSPEWLQGILKVIMEQISVTQRKPGEIIEDIRVALINTVEFNPVSSDRSKSSDHDDASRCNHFEGSPMRTPLNHPLAKNASLGIVDNGNSAAMKDKQLPSSELSKSVGKIIELIEGIGLPSQDYEDKSDSHPNNDDNAISQKNLGTATGYTVRVFQWKSSELSDVLQKTLHVCYDIQNGKVDIEKFICELTLALDWIINHCFSLQDVSCMKEAIKKQFDWDDSRSESEGELGVDGHLSEASALQPVPLSDGCIVNIQEAQSKEQEKMRKIRTQITNLESENKALEGKLLEKIDKCRPRQNQLDESGKVNEILRPEVQTSRQSSGDAKDQNEGGKVETKDLDTQVSVTRVESSEAKCTKQSGPDAGSTKERSEYNSIPKETPLRDDWEITAASEKLAECQETILNLGKQLKALATPKAAVLIDNIITPPNEKVNPAISNLATNNGPSPLKGMSMKQRPSLLDQMLAEDNAKAHNFKSPMSIPATEPLEKILLLNGKENNQVEDAEAYSLAIVPSKKSGNGSLWKKLLWRKRKGKIKKTAPSFAA